MKYINRKETVESLVAIGPISISKPPAKKKTKPLVIELKYYWYQVAIMRNSEGRIYTKTIDQFHHRTSIENEPNFVRWEFAQEGKI